MVIPAAYRPAHGRRYDTDLTAAERAVIQANGEVP